MILPLLAIGGAIGLYFLATKDKDKPKSVDYVLTPADIPANVLGPNEIMLPDGTIASVRPDGIYPIGK